MVDIVGLPEQPGRPTDHDVNREVTAEQTNQTFKTPEMAAAADQLRPIPPNSDNSLLKGSFNDNGDKPAKSPHWPPQKRIVLIAIPLIIALVGGSLFLATQKPDKTASQTTKTAAKKPAPPKPTTVPSTLSGLEVDPTLNQRTVTGVMVENSTQARPQSGLGPAGVVFEAIAEGGITRFLALYQDTAPENIGPVRSARPYFVQWAMGFDAGYAHVGGSPEALANIRTWGARDLDQFFNAGAYRRIAERAAPHNVYTSAPALHQLAVGKGYTTSTYTGFPRKKAAPLKTPTARTIDLRISGPVYNVHYDYNPATNSYNRSVGGAPHIDANTNTQLSPKVVIAMIVPYGLAADRYHSIYQSLGTGQAYIFQDGNLTIGNWSKPDIKSQVVFTDANGQPIPLIPGQTWLTALGSNAAISSAP